VRRSFVVFLTSIAFVPFLILPLLAQDSSGQSEEKHEGTGPRAKAAAYQAHTEKEGFSLGAELVSPKEASKIFAADVNRCCLVVQVAVYPKKDQPIDLSLYDFTLVEVSSDKRVRPESPTTVAAKLQDKKNPPGGVGVTTATGVGYESGTYTDPVTGQPVHVRGVTTSAGVGVSTGDSVPPDVADRDQKIIERELYDKGLPSAKVSIPVAGYLYFFISKPKKDAKYQLVYSGLSEPLTLSLP
jgi:hypothetical protein